MWNHRFLIVLGLLRSFADRACMCEGLGVWASYVRGWRVLAGHFGPVLLLCLIQILVTIALGAILLVPNIVLGLCCIGWPILLLAQGTAMAFFSTMWTLAWREWSGGGRAK